MVQNVGAITAGPTQCIAGAPAQAPWVLWIDAIIA